MITIVASRKGGVGKTTLACSLAAYLANQSNSVLLIDADPQKSSATWVARREAKSAKNGSIAKVDVIIADLSGPGSQFGKKLKALPYDHVIIDLQGADGEKNRTLLLHADKIIIPSKPSPTDIWTLKKVAEMLKDLQELNPSFMAHYVLNECSTIEKISLKMAIEYFDTFDLPLAKNFLYCRKAYRDCISVGLGITEGKNGKAKEEFESLALEIYGDTSKHYGEAHENRKQLFESNRA